MFKLSIIYDPCMILLFSYDFYNFKALEKLHHNYDNSVTYSLENIGLFVFMAYITKLLEFLLHRDIAK